MWYQPFREPHQFKLNRSLTALEPLTLVVNRRFLAVLVAVDALLYIRNTRLLDDAARALKHPSSDLPEGSWPAAGSKVQIWACQRRNWRSFGILHPRTHAHLH